MWAQEGGWYLLGKDTMLSWSKAEGVLLDCLSDACEPIVPVCQVESPECAVGVV